MVSSLGLDAVTSCAAARAGIVRIGALDDLRILDEAGELVALAGHQVPLLSAGLFGYSRLLQLALSAVEDLRRRDPTADDHPVGLILVQGSEWHRAAWIDHRRSAQSSSDTAGDVAGDERHLSADKQRAESALLTALITRARISVRPKAQRTIQHDEGGFVMALEQAAIWLAEGVCETCWIGGVDSFLDPPTIKALTGLGLLRTPTNPVGLIPGEMGCFLSLKQANERRPSGTLAVIETFGLSASAGKGADTDPPTSRALLEAISAACAGETMEFAVVNLNGSATRAMEWGTALVQSKSRSLANGPATWIPPLHFGDIGSATGPASIAMLAHGWARGHTPARKALVCLMGAGPTRGAITVHNPKGE